SRARADINCSGQRGSGTRFLVRILYVPDYPITPDSDYPRLPPDLGHDHGTSGTSSLEDRPVFGVTQSEISYGADLYPKRRSDPRGERWRELGVHPDSHGVPAG